MAYSNISYWKARGDSGQSAWRQRGQAAHIDRLVKVCRATVEPYEKALAEAEGAWKLYSDMLSPDEVEAYHRDIEYRLSHHACPPPDDERPTVCPPGGGDEAA